MRNIKIFVVALCAAMVCAASAQAQKKVTAPKKAKTTKVAKAAKAGKAAKKGTKTIAAKQEAKADTVSIEDFSYALGLANSEGLKPYLAQRMNIDTTKMDDFMRGLNEALAKPADKQLDAYASGIEVGHQLMNQMLPSINKRITGKDNSSYVNVDKFKEGFLAAVVGTGVKIPADSANKVVRSQMEFYNNRLMMEKYGDNLRAGEKFLEENAKKPGVKTLKGSTVQYKVITEGKGATPKPTDKVKVDYEGKLIDGTVFDSSIKRGKPATFEADRVIQGWQQALTQMPVGSEWEIYIPQDLAYGAREAGDKIKPFSALIFKVKLIDIEPEEKKDEAKKAAPAAPKK